MAKYIYKHFIPENVAPSGATHIGVYYANEKKVHQFSLGRLTPPTGEKLYSFGLISDTHLVGDGVYSNVFPSIKFRNAMSWFDGKVDFICHCGDVTNHGFYVNTETGEADLVQFAEYDSVRKLHPNTPIYCTFGNHDSYHASGDVRGRPLTDDLTLLETYTGLTAVDEHGKGVLHYRVDHAGDVFLFVGQTSCTVAMSNESYAWLVEQINGLNGKRCFIFVHPFFSQDSGDTTSGAYGSSLLDGRSGLKSLLAQTPNVVLFHGHSHFRFNQQEVEETMIYTRKNGFHSVHVPSLSAPAFVNASGKREQTTYDSYGFLVDVYADHIILRGRNFGEVSGSTMINPSWDAHGTYKIDAAQPKQG